MFSHDEVHFFEIHSLRNLRWPFGLPEAVSVLYEVQACKMPKYHVADQNEAFLAH